MELQLIILFFSYLFTTNNRRSVTDLMPMIGARFYTQLDALQSQIDMQEDELAKEMENGRLYRILVKLNSINERPKWAEIIVTFCQITNFVFSQL